MYNVHNAPLSQFALLGLKLAIPVTIVNLAITAAYYFYKGGK